MARPNIAVVCFGIAGVLFFVAAVVRVLKGPSSIAAFVSVGVLSLILAFILSRKGTKPPAGPGA